MADVKQEHQLIDKLLWESSNQGCLIPSWFKKTLNNLSAKEFSQFADAVLELSFWTKGTSYDKN